jgi:CBS-domain-containing membrane protein
MTTAREIMTPDPVTCSSSTAMNEAARLMWDHDIGILPVVDGDGRLSGTITDRDIAMAAYMQNRPLSELEVRNAMTQGVRSVVADADLTDVEMIMADEQVRRLPVIDDNGRPIGMVSLNDMARNYSESSPARVRATDLAETMRAICQPRRVRARA